MNPFDIEQQAEAFHRALTMRADERRVRARNLVRVVEENSVEKWVSDAVRRHRVASSAAAETARGEAVAPAPVAAGQPVTPRYTAS